MLAEMVSRNAGQSDEQRRGAMSEALLSQLRETIRRRKLKQEDVAERAGMSPSTLSKILRGKRKLGVEQLDQLAKALELDTRTLVSVDSPLSNLDYMAVPVIPIRRVPVGVSPEKVREAVLKVEHELMPFFTDDEKAFALRLQEPMGDDMPAGTILLITPSKTPRKNSPYAFQLGPRTLVGSYLEDAGVPLVLYDGELYREFSPLGPVFSSTRVHL